MRPSRAETPSGVGACCCFNPLCNGAGFATHHHQPLQAGLESGFNPLCNGAGFATVGDKYRLAYTGWFNEYGFNPLCNGAGFATPCNNPQGYLVTACDGFQSPV